MNRKRDTACCRRPGFSEETVHRRISPNQKNQPASPPLLTRPKTDTKHATTLPNRRLGSTLFRLHTETTAANTVKDFRCYASTEIICICWMKLISAGYTAFGSQVHIIPTHIYISPAAPGHVFVGRVGAGTDKPRRQIIRPVVLLRIPEQNGMAWHVCGG